MHRFETQGPITAAVEIPAGNVRVTAADRAQAEVEIRPSDPGRRLDAAAAEAVHVDFAGGQLVVRGARRRRSWRPFGDHGSVEVAIALPAGSRLTGSLMMGTLRCSGPLGDCRLGTAVGDLHVEEARAVVMKSATGTLAVDRALGDVQVGTASGAVRIGAIGGSAVVKNSNGDTSLGEVAGDLRVRAANGDIAIALARSSTVAKTAKGDIRIEAVGQGPVVAETGMGSVEVGVPEGTAAWLDLGTGFGRIDNRLEAAGPPGPHDPRVEVRARSGMGDITIRRAAPRGEREVAAHAA